MESRSINLLDLLSDYYHHLFFIFYLIVINLVSYYLSILTEQSSSAYITIFLSGLFIYGFFYILRSSRNLINITFSISLLFYFFMTIIQYIGYIKNSYRDIWAVSGFFYLIAPLGIYISIKLLINNEKSLSTDTWFILLSTLLFATISIFFYDSKSRLNVVFSDSFIILLLSLILISYFTNKEELLYLTKEMHKFIIGVSIAVFGLGLNLILFFFTGNSYIIRLIFPFIGLLIIIISFENIPKDSFSSNSINNFFGNKLIIFKKRLELILPSLYTFFDSNKLNSFIPVPSPILASEPEERTFENKKFDERLISVNMESETDRKSYSEKKISSNTINNLIDTFHLSNQENSDFNDNLKNDISGLAIEILIETASYFPKGITNILLQNKINKSKTTIIDQTAKLISMGFLNKGFDLQDTRKKPILLTEKGYKFLCYLYTILDAFVKSKNLNIYQYNSIIQE